MARRAFFILAIAMCLAYLIAAYEAFPAMDDGYLLLVIKELGFGSVPAYQADRPLVGWIWEGMGRLLGSRFWEAGYLINALLWFCLAFESALLWRAIFPDHEQYSWLVACVALSPVVLQVQITTITVSMIGVLSTILAYAALGLVFRSSPRARPWQPVAGLLILAAATLLSEYAVAAAIALVVLALARVTGASPEQKRSIWRWAGAVMTVTIACYAAHLTLARLSRPRVDPRLMLSNFDLVLNYPFGLLSRVWHVLAGAYLSVAGAFFVHTDSKSSVVAAGAGCMFAVAYVAGSRGRNARPPTMRKQLWLLAALGAGLTPVALMRPYPGSPVGYTLQNAFDSRFYIPVIPIAAALTVAILLTVFRVRFRLAAVAVLGMVCGVALAQKCWTGYKEQQFMSRLGRALKPYVAAGPDYTAAVLSGHEYCMVDTSCTAKATANYPPELSRKTWVCLKGEGVKLFGSRAACAKPPEIHTTHPHAKRDGRVANLLWVEAEDYDRFTIEPYCVSAGGG